MSKTPSSFAARAASAIIAIAIAGGAHAQEVTLKSADGTLDLRGELLDFSDNVYTLRTALGELKFPANRVRCEGVACPSLGTETADVTMRGSDTIGVGLMPLMMEGFAQSQEAAVTIAATQNAGEITAELIGEDGFGDELASVLVTSTSSGDAFTALLENSADVGLSARRIRPDEARALRDAGAGNMIDPRQEHIFAVDSLVVITHPDNPVKSLTMDQLKRIYSNEITNWSEVGGPDERITVMHRREGTGTREIFMDRVFDGEEPYIPWSIVSNDNNQMAANVNNGKWSIGYVGYAFQRGAQALNLVNECGLSMRPDAFSARTEEYALQRRLYLYTRADVANSVADDFIQFATSNAADAVVAKAGFIGLGIDRKPMLMTDDRALRLQGQQVDAYETRMATEMLETMINYDRLSTTFRFRTGSSRLDERGQIDLERLVEYLKNEAPGSEVLVVGFTDSVGSFDSNMNLSKDRARQVMEEILRAGGEDLADLTIDAEGFGELSPAACNVDNPGRRINRRVEIWIRTTAA